MNKKGRMNKKAAIQIIGLLIIIILIIIIYNIAKNNINVSDFSLPTGKVTNIPDANAPPIGTKTNQAFRLQGDAFETYSKVEICLLPPIVTCPRPEPGRTEICLKQSACPGISDIDLDFGNRGYVPFGTDYATKEVRSINFLSFNIYYKQFEQGSLSNVQFEVISPDWLNCLGEGKEFGYNLDGTLAEPPIYCWKTKLYEIPDNHTTVLIKYRYNFIPVGDVRTSTLTTIKTTTSIVGPKSCDLKEVIWASSEADIGETIVIGVAALNCDNELINFFVREADTFSLDDSVRINPESARIEDDIAVSTWEAEWQTDCNGFCNPPEYYIIAQQASNPENIIFSSTNLKVNKRIQAKPEAEPEILELEPLPPQKDIVIA